MPDPPQRAAACKQGAKTQVYWQRGARIDKEWRQLGHQRTANRHTLTLTTGERFRFAIMASSQAFREYLKKLPPRNAIPSGIPDESVPLY